MPTGPLSSEEAGGAPQLTSFRRWLTYWLVSIHSLSVYITRGCIPFIVPFLVNENGWTEGQRAMLLNSFTPGYLLTQARSGSPRRAE